MLSHEARVDIVQYVDDHLNRSEDQMVDIQEEALNHIEHLESAVYARMKSIFIDYVLWKENMLTSRGFDPKGFINSLIETDERLSQVQGIENKEMYQNFLQQSISLLNERTTGV